MEGRTLKNRLLVSTAAPNNGALMPRYSPKIPSARHDCLKQSNGPLYCTGNPSGCDWRRTLTVSNGYSINLPTMPAIEPNTISFTASFPCSCTTCAVVLSTSLPSFIGRSSLLTDVLVSEKSIHEEKRQSAVCHARGRFVLSWQHC